MTIDYVYVDVYIDYVRERFVLAHCLVLQTNKQTNKQKQKEAEKQKRKKIQLRWELSIIIILS